MNTTNELAGNRRRSANFLLDEPIPSLLPSRWQLLEHKPHAHCQFENKDRTAVNPYGNNRRKIRKDDEGVCAHSHQEGCEHSEAGQCSRNEARLEPQITEGGAAQSGEHEADVVYIRMR